MRAFFASMFVWSIANSVQAGSLHEAAVAGDFALVETLIAEGADIDEFSAIGPPLVWALSASQVKVAKLLLEHGADPNVETVGWTPLAYAIKSQDPDLILAMLDAGADVDAGEDLSPLAASAEADDPKTAMILLDRGADPNREIGPKKYTALHFAAISGSLSVTKALIAAGVDLGKLGFDGDPAIHVAMENGHIGVADEIRAAGWRPGYVEPIDQLLPTADPVRGKEVGGHCLNCHRTDAAYAGHVGPYFWKIVGRKVGALEDYNYSDALMAAGEVWDVETLNRFMARPTEMAPGVRMFALGLANAQDRADFMAYLMTLTDD